MADKVLIWALTTSVICCILPCLNGDGHPGYVPLGSDKVGVPLTMSFSRDSDVTEEAAADVAAVVEEGELLETAAGDLESEVSLEEWEDENQEDTERVAYVGGVCRSATYVDAMLGRMTRPGGFVLPGDIGLTIVPTGANRTEMGKHGNGTEKTRKILCVGRNLTEEETPTVALVNNTGLLAMLGLRNDSSWPNCAVVMFYAPWCPFCSKAAPHYNALARAFPQMNVLAIDAAHFSNLNARFGTVAVPNILIFHNAKAVARFNATMRTLELMTEFISNITGLTPVANVSVMEHDLQGPLPSEPTAEPDYLLFVSWAFNIFFFLYIFTNSSLGRRVWQSFATFGREPEHQQID